jgi:hypothetical protein
MAHVKCEVVASIEREGVKVGEEVRFYTDDKAQAHVKTVHLFQPSDWGNFIVGKCYDEAALPVGVGEDSDEIAVLDDVAAGAGDE